MPSDAWQIDAAAMLEAAIEEFGLPLTFGAAAAVQVITEPASDGRQLLEPGYQREGELVVEMRRSDLAVLQAAGLDLGGKVVVSGVAYRLLRTIGDAADYGVRLQLTLF